MTRQTVSVMATKVIHVEESPSRLIAVATLENDFHSAKTLLATFRRCFRAWKHTALKITGPAEDMRRPLTILELMDSETHLLQLTQEESFGPILTSMRKGLSFGKAVSKLRSNERKSWMREVNKLLPFLDADQVLRVGGKLQ